MGIPRACTPTVTLVFDDNMLDLTDAVNVYVTFRQDVRRITKTGEDIEVSPLEISVYLSQQETLSFHDGLVEVQANWTYADGSRAASNIAVIELTKQLLDKVVI